MSQDLFREMKEKYPSFSKGQKMIADYMTKHYDKAAFMTAAKLGQTVGVSESTVVRFVTELGFDSYHDMKKSLRQLTRSRLTAIQRVKITEELVQDADPLTKVLQNDILNITETLSQITPQDFEAAIKQIVGAKNVYVLGVRNAGTLADFLAFNLNLILDGVHRVDAAGSAEVYEQILRIGPGDVIIGISFPRYSHRTVQALRFARDRGAEVLAITDSSSSPLAPYADKLLLARSDMAGFVDSLTAPMSLINALIVGVTMKRQEAVEQRFGELEAIWEEYQVYDKVDGEEKNG